MSSERSASPDHAYPPPPRHPSSSSPSSSSTARQRNVEIASASTPSTTLYSASPHLAHDRSARARLQRAAARTAKRTDPFIVVLFILFAWLAWNFSPLGRASAPNYHRGHTCCEHSPHYSSNNRDHKTLNVMPWQKTFTLPSRGKGCHLVQDVVNKEIAEGLKGVKIGTLNLFLQHTSAALSIGENFDRDVRTDMDMAMDKIVPENFPWRHTDEGPDDSASHTKSSLFGVSVTIPITDGRLNLGTWQSVYLCEWRVAKHSRHVVATILP